MSKQKIPKISFPWNSDLAYAIGLLTTDGNLSGDGRHMSFRSCDIDQVKTLRKILGLSNKIESPPPLQPRGRVCYRIQFGNVKFYHWLEHIGLTPAKSRTIGQLKIPNVFFRDFLRGHLDGDGGITSYQDKYNTSKNPSYVYTRIFVRFISASPNHIKWLRRKIVKLCSIDGDLFRAKPKYAGCAPMWQLKFMKKESIKLLRWLYYSPDIPALARKRTKAESVLAHLKTIKRKPYTFHEQPSILK